MKKPRHFSWYATGVVVVVLVFLGFRPRPVPVDTAAVTEGPLRVTVDEEGKTRVIDRFTISAPVNGHARRIDLDVGDAVDRGQTLVVLAPMLPQALDRRQQAEAEARVAAERSAVDGAIEAAEAAGAGAKYWLAEQERARDLRQAGAISQERLDLTETQARQASAQLSSAEFAVEIARANLAAAEAVLAVTVQADADDPDRIIRLTSPVQGTVLKVIHESEGAVAAGQPLLEVGDPGALEVETEVLSADAVRIQPGAPAVFERWGGATALRGRVRRVEPAGFTKISALGVEEQRVLVISDFETGPSDWRLLGDGYRVESSFVLWESDSVLQIPGHALFRHGNSWAVFLVEDGRAKRQSVVIGHRSGLAAEVLEGLQQGQVVISHPDRKVEDGVRVSPRTDTHASQQ